eukprot:5237684-Amphidinium_carterae.1
MGDFQGGLEGVLRGYEGGVQGGYKGGFEEGFKGSLRGHSLFHCHSVAQAQSLSCLCNVLVSAFVLRAERAAYSLTEMRERPNPEAHERRIYEY